MPPLPPIFVSISEFFFVSRVVEGKIKKWGKSGGEGMSVY
jgi:hypothetical protein